MTSSSLIIRELSSEYVEPLVRFDQNSNPHPWTDGMIRQEFKNQYSKIYGGFLEDQLIAYLVVHVVLDELHIVNLVVDKDNRNHGHGTQLMIDIIGLYNDKGCSKGYLEVRKGNDAAVALYEGLGFRKVGVRPKYYSDNQEDALIMHLSIEHFEEACVNL